MLFAIMAEDVKNSLKKRLTARPEHLARLEQLDKENRLILAGPHPATDENEPKEVAFTGSLIVAAFDSLISAKAWADADPYKKAGVYQHITVKPFKQVFPKEG